ncbi:MAG: hypothetical protein R8M14_07125 [Ghiorsea sp.]
MIIFYFQDMWQLAMQGQTQGVWFYAALYVFIVCCYSLIFQVRTRSWPYTVGKLNALGIMKFGTTGCVVSHQDYTANALYKYDESGVIYNGTKISPWIFEASHNARIILDQQMASVQQLPDGKV